MAHSTGRKLEGLYMCRRNAQSMSDADSDENTLLIFVIKNLYLKLSLHLVTFQLILIFFLVYIA